MGKAKTRAAKKKPAPAKKPARQKPARKKPATKKPATKKPATKRRRPSAATPAEDKRAAPKKRVGAKRPAPKQRPAKKVAAAMELAAPGGLTVRLKKIDMDAELEAELAQIFETGTLPVMKPAPATPAATITPAAADELAGGKWFTGYTNAVQLIDGPATVTAFDGDSRGGDAEYLVFDKGRTITGTLDLSGLCPSIIVVRGTLKAKRIVLGDAVLVVEKAVQASELIFGPMTEGVFSLAGMQIESDPEDLATAISAPIVALYDRKQREWLLRKNGVPAELAADLVDDGEVDASAVKQRLLAGRSIFD
ncbi:hypothetical protein BH11MYX1_BH11MYX1_23030 [soil metagenome]